MDESLSDFKETKKSVAGPKTVAKSKTKPKKAPKRIRGQKDIRTVLKSKKNDLESYSKDFGNVCKQAGIDVDPEQLQLAIALSKSLQENSTSTEEQSNSRTALTSQGRVGRIRTTLLEYGFKVPEVKINATKKRGKTYKKHYKLLTTSTAEKEAIIANKYSQILFEDIHTEATNIITDFAEKRFYYLSTYATYKYLKNNDNLYVKGLVEKSTNSGNLLRDWSEIPGRPVSPTKAEPFDMDFSEIECSQDELDMVLSGTIKNCQNVVKSKQRCEKLCQSVTLDEEIGREEGSGNNEIETVVIDDNDDDNEYNNDDTVIYDENDHLVMTNDENNQDVTKINHDCKSSNIKDAKINDKCDNNAVGTELNNHIVVKIPETLENNKLNDIHNNMEEIHDNSDKIEDINKTRYIEDRDYRSHSPDLFDDDISIVDDPKDKSSHHNLSQDKTLQHATPLTSVTNLNNDIMDLTECANNVTKQTNNFKPSQDITKRKSNDFMDMTNCDNINHETTETKNFEKTSQNNMFTSQNNYTKRKSNDFMEITDCVPQYNKDKVYLAQNVEDKNSTKTPTKDLSNADTYKHIDEDNNNLNTSNRTPNILDPINDEIVISDSPEIVKHNNNRLELSPIPSTSKCTDYNVPLTDLEVNDSPELLSIEDQRYNTKERANNNGLSLDLTQLSDSSEDLPFVSLDTRKITSKQNEPYYGDNSEIIYKDEDMPAEDVFDLTQDFLEIEKVDKHVKISRTSFFDEFVHNHSSSRENSVDSDVSMDYANNIQKNAENNSLDKSITASETNTCPKHLSKDSNKEIGIDLTQTSESSEDRSQNYSSNFDDDSHNEHTKNDNDVQFTDNNDNCSKNNQRSSSLGKRGDISIDYDEFVEPNGSMTSKRSNKSLNKSYLEGELDDYVRNHGKKSQNKTNLDNYSQNLTEYAKEPNFIENNDCFSINNPRCSSLGKKDDVSIDYDEFIEPNAKTGNESKLSNKSLKKSYLEGELDQYDLNPNENFENDDLEVINDFEINNYECSQNSEIFQISDKELDYSIHRSKVDRDNFDIGGLSVIDDISKVIRPSTNFENSLKKNLTSLENSAINDDAVIVIEDNENAQSRTPIKHKRISEITPQKRNANRMVVETPNKSKLIINTGDVTPMPCYEAMSTPEIHTELDKYGIKPFKRKRAIQLLTHIYNQLHPYIEYSDEDATPTKRMKLNNGDTYTQVTPRKILNSPRKTTEKINNYNSYQNVSHIENQNGRSSSDKENLNTLEGSKDIVYEKTNDPEIREVHCDPIDWVFQKRERAKLHSCRVPLHIAFHNYVTSRHDLHEAILRYEPIHIDVVHKDLVGYGHKYDPKDLLKFFDKKCITVKTTDNDARNQKR